MTTKKSKRKILPFGDTIAQMTMIAMQAPLNRAEQTSDFAELLRTIKATPLGSDYLARIDKAKILSRRDKNVLTEEATAYLLALAMYYALQMQNWVKWQTNSSERIIHAGTYAHVTEETILTTLTRLGCNDKEKRTEENQKICRRRQKYIKLRTIDRVYLKDHKYAPVFREMLIKNAGKRIELDAQKTELVEKYAVKIHSVASAYFWYVQKRCVLVGIQHVFQT